MHTYAHARLHACMHACIRFMRSHIVMLLFLFPTYISLVLLHTHLRITQFALIDFALNLAQSSRMTAFIAQCIRIAAIHHHTRAIIHMYIDTYKWSLSCGLWCVCELFGLNHRAKHTHTHIHNTMMHARTSNTYPTNLRLGVHSSCFNLSEATSSYTYRAVMGCFLLRHL